MQSRLVHRLARPVRVGIAVDAERLVAVELRRTVRGPRPGTVRRLALESVAEGALPAIAPVLATLRAGVGPRRVIVSVALHRPFAQAKVIAVPPVASAEVGQLVARSARRWFAVGGGPLAADARPVRGRVAEGRAAAVAVCAPQAVVNAVVEAVGAAGFTLDAMTAAPVAIAEALRVLAPRVRRGRVDVIVGSPGQRELLRLERGVPRSLQGAGAAGDPDDRQGAVTPATLGGTLASLDAADPMAVAAFGAALLGDDATVLLPEPARLARARCARRRTGAILAASALVLCAAGGLSVYGAGRELAAVEARRAEIAPAVMRAMAARRAASDLHARADMLERLAREAPRWTTTLAALSEALPDSAHVASIAAQGGQLRMRIVAPVGEPVVASLERSPIFERVVPFTPPARDESRGIERHDLTIALDSASAPGRSRVARGDAA